MSEKDVDTQIDAEFAIGKWLSAALDDPDVCAEMKLAIVNWFTFIETSKEREAGLFAQNNELRLGLSFVRNVFDLVPTKAELSVNPVIKDLGIAVNTNGGYTFINKILSKTPEQSLTAHNKRIRDAAIDEVKEIVLEEPDYIASSQSTRQGYVRAVNDMKRKIEEL